MSSLASRDYRALIYQGCPDRLLYRRDWGSPAESRNSVLMSLGSYHAPGSPRENMALTRCARVSEPTRPKCPTLFPNMSVRDNGDFEIRAGDAEIPGHSRLDRHG